MRCSLRHTGLVVSDLDRALHLWCDIFGFKIIKQIEEQGSFIDNMLGLDNVLVTTVKLSDSFGNLIELLFFHSHPDDNCWRGTPFSTGFTHVALTVDDIQMMVASLQNVGFTFSALPQTSPDGSVLATYAKGPDGILLELVEMLQT